MTKRNFKNLETETEADTASDGKQLQTMTRFAEKDQD